MTVPVGGICTCHSCEAPKLDCRMVTLPPFAFGTQCVFFVCGDCREATVDHRALAALAP